MEAFEAPIQKDDAGRLTFFEIPFHARERFCKPKGTIYVSGTINGAKQTKIHLQAGSGRYGHGNALLWVICAYGQK